MPDQEIQKRTFEFARRIIRVARALDQDRIGRIIVGQLLRSGTSIGANVEEAQGAQSKADFVAKMAIARKEARETLYWLRLIQAEGIIRPDRLEGLIEECDSVLRVVASITANAHKNL